MLIRAAELDFGARVADVRVRDGRIAELAPHLRREGGEAVVEAGGAALLPALADHHIHLYALAAARASVPAGPPDCRDADALAAALRAADGALPHGQWLRAVGFHDSLMQGSGRSLDRDWLDCVVPQRPVRVQHRSGRRWTLNSAALHAIGVLDAQGTARTGIDCPVPIDALSRGELTDADAWLRARLPSALPDLAPVSQALWTHGVVACTDTSHDNDPAAADRFADAQARGALLQDLTVMGSDALHGWVGRNTAHGRVRCGARKFHLHDHALPDFDDTVVSIRSAHAAGRNVAFHCVSRVDLTFALAAVGEAGTRTGDRIEHASITPPEALTEMHRLGLRVVTQPGLLGERGDRYRVEVDAADQPWLYRVRAFLDAGVALAMSSDAPYSAPQPWVAMAAAVERRDRSGAILGRGERITPEQAMSAWRHDVWQGRRGALLAVGDEASMCLLAQPWRVARRELAAVSVVATWKRGRMPDPASFTFSE